MDEELVLLENIETIEEPQEEGAISQDSVNVETSELDTGVAEFDSELDNDSSMEETTLDVLEVETVEEIEIEVDEAIGWSGGDTGRHYALPDRNEPNQHIIGSITGLKEKLDEIERLKIVESSGVNVANYYKWEGNKAYDENGYFVSLTSDPTEIKICEGSDVLGVTVDSAGFIGGQNTYPRNNHYGLVATSGLVDVRCELDINVGDCVVSNAYGYAKKADSNYGYKVLARANKNGIEYAVIALGAQADMTNELGIELAGIQEQVDANYRNIISAVNVANQAYNKVTEIDDSNRVMSGKVDEAIGKVNGVASEVENLTTQVSNSAFIATQAKTIAESAVTSAESMRQDAIDEANKALSEVTKLKDEFNVKSNELDIEIEKTALDLQKAKDSIELTKNELQDSIDGAVGDLEKLEKDLEPLATWPDGSGKDLATALAGFVERADEDSATLASVTKLEGEFGKSITGFVQEATKNNATVKAIAAYQQKDSDGNVIANGAAGIISQVDANKSAIDALASLEGEGFSGLSGMIAQVSANKSSVETLASHVVGEFENTDDWVEDDKDESKVYYAKNNKRYYYYDTESGKWLNTEKAYEAGLTGAMTGVQQIADDSKAQLDALASYQAKDEDDEPIYSVAGIIAHVDKNSAEVSQLATYSFTDDDGNPVDGAAGLIAQVDKNKSEISAIATYTFTKNDKTHVTGLAGLNAYVNDNESNVSLISDRVTGDYIVLEEEWNPSDKYDDKVYYVKAATKDEENLWYYYENGWKSTEDPYVAGLPRAMAGIQSKTDDNSASIDNLVSWQGNTNIAMARIEQKADANGAYIQSTVSNIDKYSVGPHSQAYGFTLEQAASVLEEGMIYVPANKTPTDVTSKIVETYTLASKAESISSWSETGKDKTKVYSIYNENTKVTTYYYCNGYDYNNKKCTWASSTTIPTYQREFMPTYLYKWGQLGGAGPYRWITVDKFHDDTDVTNTSAPAVYFAKDRQDASGTFSYWYTNGTEVTEGYNQFTLYKWMHYKKTNLDGTVVEDDDGNPILEYQWVAVATLAGNSQNRAVSQIRQDANSIEMRVTNVEGSAAVSKQWINDNSANIQDVVTWKSENADSIATFMSTAGDNFASASQVANIVDEDGNVIESSIVTAVNNNASSIYLDADNINFEGSQFVSTMSETYSTKKELANYSTIKQTEDSISLSISNIEVGGRNLLIGSATGDGWICTSFDDGEYELTQDNNTTKENYIYCNNLFDLDAGKEYTLSFKAKQNGCVHSMDVYILPKTWQSTGIAYQNVRLDKPTTEYKEYKLTFTPNSAATNLTDCQLRIDNNGSTASGEKATLYVKEVKLERGNKATGWTPAPEDMVGKNNIISSINLSEEGITISADKINIDGAVTFSSLSSEMQTSFNNTIASTVIEYAQSESATSAPTSGWSTTAPQWQEGKYMWQKTTITYTDSKKDATVTTTCIQGAKGGNGSAPYIGANGNWWIGDTDTSVKAEAQNGNSLQVKYINSATIPTITSNNVSAWSDTVPTVETGKHTYMIQKMSNATDWSTPVQISARDGTTPTIAISGGYWVINGETSSVKAEGQNGDTPVITVGSNGNWYINGADSGQKAQGEAGKDGSCVEYVYYRSQTEQTNLSAPTYTNGSLTSGWSVIPLGITKTYKYEYMSMRTKPSGTNTSWTAFSTPVIWSKWGEKGQDGDGVEYKYCLINSSTKPTYPTPSGKTYTWKDEPTGVSASNQYEYVVQIKTTTVNGETTTFASDVALWAKWGKDGNTPYVGTNGNWWIGTNDTGVKADVKDGVGITGVKTQYCLSNDNTNAPTSGWTEDFNNITTKYWNKNETNNKYIWRREEITYDDGRTPTHTTAVVDTGSSAISKWCVENDKALINGANIATGSITAQQIDTEGLQAEYIESSNYSRGTIESIVLTERGDGTYKVGLKRGSVSETVIIPKSYNGKLVSEIDNKSFAYGKEIIKTLAIPSSVTKIPFGFLEGYLVLKELHIPFHTETPSNGGNGAYFCHWFGMSDYDAKYNIPASLSKVYLSGRSSNDVIPKWYFNTDTGSSSCEVYLTPTVLNIGEDTFEYYNFGKIYHYGQIDATSSHKVSFEILEEPYVFPSDNNVVSGFRISSKDSNMISSPYFKVTQDGEVTANSGDIAGWKITEDALYKNTNGISSGMCSIYYDDNVNSSDDTGESKTPSVGLSYSINSDGRTCAIIGLGQCVDKDICIGKVIDGYTVTSIGDSAFRDCTSLMSVTIPDSVTSIGFYAFYNCTSLTSVTIGDSVTSIGDDAFEDCTSLTSVTIGDSVTSIGNYAFYNCNSLTSITIPDSVRSIGNLAFSVCSSLTSITIPDSVTSIGQSAFRSCRSLMSVTIGNNVTIIGYGTFAYCISLMTVTIADGVMSIEENAFYYCIALTNIIIPNSVKYIGKSAFALCNSALTIYCSHSSEQSDWSSSWNIKSPDGTDVFDVVWGHIPHSIKSLAGDGYSYPRFFAGSQNTIPRFDDEAKFLVLEDGSLYASAVDIKGTIHATDGEFNRGKIACFDLTNDGLTLTKDGETMSLNASGLMLSGSPFNFSLGNLNIHHESDTGTLLSASGALSLQGANDTMISLMSDGGDVARRFEATCDFAVRELWLGGFGTEGVVFCLSGLSSPPFYPFDVTIWYEFSDESVGGGSITTTYTPSNYGAREVQVGARSDALYGKFRFKTIYSDWSSWYGAKDIRDNVTGWDGTTVGGSNQIKRNNNVTIQGNIVPKTSNSSYTLGESERAWNVVYTKDGTVQKSDRNVKNTILQIDDAYGELFDDLKPVTYKFNKNESNRTHVGFIAQDVKNSIVSTGLTTQDFAGYCEWENSDGTIGCGLRYGEFIALCVDQIQKLKKQTKELEEKNDELEKRLAKIESLLNANN